MTDFDYKASKDLLSNASKIVITTHVSPDGDAIGSSLALCLLLEKSNYDCVVVTPDQYPEFLHWLPGHERVLNYDGMREESEKAVSEADLIFCLDFNSSDRLSGFEKVIVSSDAPKILIDHHQEPEQWTEVMLSDSSASSTAELIYRFITGIGKEKDLDKEIGSCLYVGIVTDTGSFKFPSTTSETLRIAANLMDLGVDGAGIQNLVYDNSSEHRLRLMGYALTEKLEIIEEYHAAIMGLTAEELKRFNYKSGDTEGLVNYPLGISSVRMSVFVSNKNGEVRLSFRSKGKIPVHEIAKKYFNGGGHVNAAGGISDKSVEDTVEFIKSILPEFSSYLCS